jgi:hypothetical protein
LQLEPTCKSLTLVKLWPGIAVVDSRLCKSQTKANKNSWKVLPIIYSCSEGYISLNFKTKLFIKVFACSVAILVLFNYPFQWRREGFWRPRANVTNVIPLCRTDELRERFARKFLKLFMCVGGFQLLYLALHCTSIVFQPEKIVVNVKLS